MVRQFEPRSCHYLRARLTGTQVVAEATTLFKTKDMQRSEWDQLPSLLGSQQQHAIPFFCL